MLSERASHQGVPGVALRRWRAAARRESMGFSSRPTGPVRSVDLRELAHFSQLKIADVRLQIAEDQVRRAPGVYGDKTILLGHHIQSADNAGLVPYEAVEHIVSEADIHSAFPIVECPAAQDHA